MTAHLSIGTSTSRVNLISPTYGFTVYDWQPVAGDHESLFAQSVVGDYEILQQYRETLTDEAIILTVSGVDTDDLITRLQRLRRALRDGLNYWVEQFSTASVYIQAQGPCETNARYALVYDARLPDDGNPFAQPFIDGDGDSVMAELSLLVRRGPWLETTPGAGTCVAIAGYQADWCYPSYLDLDGLNDTVDCGSGATLDDLPDFAVAGKGQVTVDLWFRPDTWGSGGFSVVLSKAASFLFGITDGSGGLGGAGLWAYISCAAGTAASFSGLDEFTVDGNWHHVLMTYDETGGGTPAARTVYLAIDGVWVVSYPYQTPSAGNYNSDAASNMVLGTGIGTFFDGLLGWVRVSNSVRYDPAGGNFTPVPRCTLPDADANTMLLVIHEGTGSATYDLSGNANNGTISGATWGCDCTADFGLTVPTCNANNIYVANKANLAQLTHVYHYDASGPTWSGNLLGTALPYALLPAVPAVDDAAYFGIDSTALNGGPFCSLVMRITTAIANVAGTVWEYWNGAAWATLTVQDNTRNDGIFIGGVAFDTSGAPKSVHWVTPSAWAAASLVTAVAAGSPAITGWWVRCRVTAIGAGPTPPQQGIRQPYTITWPWVEIDGDQVPGDIDAWLRANLRNQSHNYADSVNLYWNQIVVSTRSLSRGADFTTYINASDVQNPDHLTIAVGVAAAFASRANSITGRIVRLANPAAAWNTAFRISFDSDYANQYQGVYHAYLRAEMTSGSTGDLRIRLRLQVGLSTLWTGDPVNIPTRTTAGEWNIIGLGRLDLPGTDAVTSADGVAEMDLYVEVYGNGAADADLLDLVIMPTDEWAGLFIGPDVYSFIGVRDAPTSTVGIVNTLLDVDSITNPRYIVRALRRQYASSDVNSIWQPRANGPAILRRGRDQRLWFFRPEGQISGSTPESAPEIADSVQLWRQARYLSMRGDQ